MFNVISGKMMCDSGNIILGDENITFMPEHKRAAFIGRIFQDPMKGTAPNLTVGENLIIAYMRSTKKNIMSVPSREEKNYIKEHLAALNLGLENRMNTKIGLLSGGQRQAVTLIMATLVKPGLLLLDEHTAALDPKTAPKVLEITEQLIQASNLTTMMVTHNMRDAIKYGNRLIMMHEGRIILDINGEEKKKLTVEDLLERFGQASGEQFANDRALLS